MKRASVFLFVALVILASGNAGWCQTYDMRDYFPITCDTNTWEYSTVHNSGSWTIGSEFTAYGSTGRHIVDSVESCVSEDLVWANDTNGLRIIGAYDSEGFTGENPNGEATKIANNLAHVGDEITSEGVNPLDDSLLTITSKFLSDTETVVVAAGTFTNCLKFEVKVVDPPADWATNLWYAKNIGIVKVERDPVGVYQSGCIIVNGGENPYQLTSYSVCSDKDGDGYGDPGDVACPNGPDTDCDNSNANIYPTNVNTNCDCADPIPQGTAEVCDDGFDNDCDGLVDDADPDCPWRAASAQASVYGQEAVEDSNVFNRLGFLFIPVGAIILLRILRRKR